MYASLVKSRFFMYVLEQLSLFPIHAEGGVEWHLRVCLSLGDFQLKTLNTSTYALPLLGELYKSISDCAL